MADEAMPKSATVIELEKSLELLRESQNKMLIEEMTASKELTEDDVKSGPNYILYNGLIDSMIRVINLGTFTIPIESISRLEGPKIADDLGIILSTMAIYIAADTVNLYDSLLKKEISAHLQTIVNKVNECISDVVAHGSVLEVHNQRMTEIENQLKMISMKDQLNNQ